MGRQVSKPERARWAAKLNVAGRPEELSVTDAAAILEVPPDCLAEILSRPAEEPVKPSTRFFMQNLVDLLTA